MDLSVSGLDGFQTEFEGALISLNLLRAREIITRAAGSLDPPVIFDELLTPVLQRLGLGWERGEISLAQVYLAGRLCQDLVDTILPPAPLDRGSRPKAAIAVLEDHHQLGKRVVYSTLRAGGFELIDYGHGLTVEDLAARAAEDRIQLLLVSTLMLRAALRVKELKARLADMAPGVKVVVGGAPFRLDDRLWQEVGADAMGRSASDALEIVSKLTGGGQ
jgi:methanogenic corrinoid protein MtbC1